MDKHQVGLTPSGTNTKWDKYQVEQTPSGTNKFLWDKHKVGQSSNWSFIQWDKHQWDKHWVGQTASGMKNQIENKYSGTKTQCAVGQNTLDGTNIE